MNVDLAIANFMGFSWPVIKGICLIVCLFVFAWMIIELTAYFIRLFDSAFKGIMLTLFLAIVVVPFVLGLCGIGGNL